MRASTKRANDHAQDFLIKASTTLPEVCNFRPINPPITLKLETVGVQEVRHA